VLTLIGVVAFILAILFSIAWHELGHLIPAKKFGVKVTQYMIGFGPTMWSKQKGETEYGVKAIPFGGYIRMIGMFPPGPDGKTKASSTGRFGALIEDARTQAQAEVLTEEDAKRTFYRLPVHKRLVVMLGGPVMNLILAFVLFTILLVGIGTPNASLSVAEVTPCTPTVSQPAGQCEPGLIASPAAGAGLARGDVVTSYNGKPVQTWDELATAVRASPAGLATIGVLRDDQPMTLDADIQVATRPVVSDGQLTDQTSSQGFLGMTPQRVLEQQPIATVPAQMWDLTVRTGQALIAIPAKLVGVSQAAFGGAERDPNGPIGVVGVTRISGEVAGGELPGEWKIAQFLGLVASLNLFLFLFNLIPLLPLDGGHVAGALWEGLRRQIARLRHRPDPGPVDVARALPVAYAVAFFLIGMSGLLLYADVVNPVKLGG
jgi:membrane-associated protease RseP (regulator of RpoE activity)